MSYWGTSTIAHLLHVVNESRVVELLLVLPLFAPSWRPGDTGDTGDTGDVETLETWTSV